MQTDTQSNIAVPVIESYRSAVYQVGVGNDAIILHIDQYSEQLLPLLAASDPPCAVFITAFNPFSQRKNPEENLARNAQLLAQLSHYSDQIIEGFSSDPLDQWPVEKSFFVLGVNLKTAVELGKQFGQNAIIWINTDAIPRLILLR